MLRFSLTRDASIPVALARGPEVLARASEPCLVASVLRGPAVLLGASQRAGRVLDLPACARTATPVFRRASAGTAAYVGREALHFALCLPHMASLAPDATARTLINRNVRGFLHGLTRAGALAHYFGREWIAVRHRPAALLGFECRTDGRTLIEVVVSLDAPIALPNEIASACEQQTERWRGKSPLALREVLGDRDAHTIAETMAAGLADRAGVPLAPLALPPLASDALAVHDANDPIPWTPSSVVRGACAVGWIDAAAVRDTRRVWLGGDPLVPRTALDAIAEALVAGGAMPVLSEEVPLEGARVEEIWETGRAALEAAQAGTTEG